jgi:hypothetical protein
VSVQSSWQCFVNDDISLPARFRNMVYQVGSGPSPHRQDLPKTIECGQVLVQDAMEPSVSAARERQRPKTAPLAQSHSSLPSSKQVGCFDDWPRPPFFKLMTTPAARLIILKPRHPTSQARPALASPHSGCIHHETGNVATSFQSYQAQVSQKAILFSCE